VVLSSGNTKLMYYDVMTMTIMVVITCCTSLKEKQDDLYNQSQISE
jgi:hypothetical protein